MSFPEPDPSLSSDATHSTYEVATDVPATQPPPGQAVVQTRGKPGATGAKSKAHSPAAKSA